MTQVIVNPRKIAGSFATFERRYGIVLDSNGNMTRDHKDLIANIDDRNVWTLVAGDSGELYIVPGYATVNYLGRIVTERQWSDVEMMNPGYVW